MRYYDVESQRTQQNIQNDLNRLKNAKKPPNIVTAFSVRAQNGTWGAVVDFTLAQDVSNVASIRLLRNDKSDYKGAVVLNTYPISTQDGLRSYRFTDYDKTLTSDQFYWVEVIPLSNRVGKQQTSHIFTAPIYNGPKTLAALNVNLLPPDAIPAFAVSLGARLGNPPYQPIYCNFTKPDDPNFASCQIRAKNYDGNKNTVAIAQSLTSPFQFNLLSLGETITLYATAISQNGVAALTSPSIIITTGGGETVPAANESLVATQIIGGIQLSWATGLEPDISAYKLYRNTVSTFGTATLIHTFTSPFSNFNTYLDTTGTDNSYYWITATNPIGTSAASNTAQVPIIPTSLDQLADGVFIKSPNFPGGEIVVDNGNFEDDPGGTILPKVPGWAALNATLAYETASPQSGTQTLKLTTSAQFGAAVTTKKWRVTPVEQYKVAGWVKSDGVGTPSIRFNFVDKNGANLGYAEATNGTNATYTFQTGNATVPASAVYAYVTLQNNTAAGAGVCYFDNVFAVRVRSTDDELFDGFTTFVNKYITIPTTEQNGVYNGGFQIFPTSVTVADGWTKDFETSGSGYTYSRNTSVPRMGTVCQAITNNGASGGTSIASRPFPVKQNASYIFETYARSTHAAPGTLYVRALFYNSSNAFTRNPANLIGFQDIVAAGGPTLANTWQAFSGLIVAPANAKYAIIALYNWVGTANTMYFQTTAAFWTALNPAYGSVDSKGILCPAGTTSLTYTNTATSLTWNWNSLKIYRSDGVVTNIANGSKVTSSLASSTTYYFYPYWDDITAAVLWVAGPRGSPAIAYLAADRTQVAAQSQNLDRCIPLSNGPVSAATTASGSGGGGTGGGGGCPAVEMWVDEWHQVKDVSEVSAVTTLKHDPEDYVYDPITKSELELHDVEWYEFASEPCHHLITENGAEVIISDSTPVPTREALVALSVGHPINELPTLAHQMKAGLYVMTDVGQGVEWSMLTSVNSVGIKRVCRLYCGGRNFAAGVKAGKYIFTHNMQMIVK